MKKLIQILTLSILLVGTSIVNAQIDAKHAINTKGAGANDKLAPCATVADQAGKHAINTKGAGSGDRSKVKDIRLDAMGITVQSGCNPTIDLDPNQPITFDWSRESAPPSMSERSTQPVTYRLKVWQLMQGQTGTTAMRSNLPIIEKDMITETKFSVASSVKGPCKPPYMCDFIWEVQAFSADGKAVGTPIISTYDLKSMK